jgi:hypothetical protein
VFQTRLIPKRYVERGRSYIRRKVWLSDALFTFFKYIVYSIVWLVYIVQVCLVYNLCLIVLFVETPHKFITAVINLRGVSTNKTIIYFIAMQTYKQLNLCLFYIVRFHRTFQVDFFGDTFVFLLQILAEFCNI